MRGRDAFDLTGRRVLVTGATGGIGREIAIVLSSLGARLIVTGRNDERLQQTVSQLEGDGHAGHTFDLKNLDQIPEWIKTLTASGGALDGLVHAAGKQVTSPLRGFNPAMLDDIFRSNVHSAAMLAKGYGQKASHNAGGSIVFVSSIMATVARPAIAAYCASKAALVGLTKSLALELAPSRTRVNCIAPAYVASGMLDALRDLLSESDFADLEAAHPLGFGVPRDVAYAAAFLLADASRWITGTTLVADGGYSAR